MSEYAGHLVQKSPESQNFITYFPSFLIFMWFSWHMWPSPPIRPPKVSIRGKIEFHTGGGKPRRIPILSLCAILVHAMNRTKPQSFNTG
jgi:hypothetical protein